MADEKPAEKEQLASSTDAYFRSLDGLKYPQALVDQFPRIANKLAELKDDKTGLVEYFNSLTSNQRDKRNGFPFGVLMNIQDLREVMVGDANGFVLTDTTKSVS